MGIGLDNNNRPVLAKLVTADHYLSHSDNNCLLVVNSNTDVTLYLSNALPTGFTTRIIQRGSGRAVLIAAGVTMINPTGLFATKNAGDSLFIMGTQPNEFLVENIGGGSLALSDPYMGTILIYGNVTWAHDLAFDVSACRYYILNNLYNTAATQVTLDPSDPALDRIDVIYVDINQQVGVLKGVAGASPVKPIVDPATQLELTFIKVAAGAVVPTGIVNLDIYQEGVEWVGNSSIAATDFVNTTDPQKGIKCVEVPAHASNGYVLFTDRSLNAITNLVNYSYLRMYVKIATPAAHGLNVPDPIRDLKLSFGGGIIADTNAVVTLNASHGYDANLFDVWQLIVVPIAQFNLSNPNVNYLAIWVNGTFTAPLYFDNIVLQGAGSAGTGGTCDCKPIKVVSANFTDATHYDNAAIVGKPLAIFFNNIPKYLEDDEWAATATGINILIPGFDATVGDYTFYIQAL